MKISLLTLIFLFSKSAYAQIETIEQNFIESKVSLSEIEKENYFKKGSFDIRTGLMQFSANKAADPLKLNSKNELPFIEIAYDRQIKNRWGVVGSFSLAQNLLPGGAFKTGTTEVLNDGGASQQTYQLGVQYKMILDETMIKNYVTFKLQYYSMSNNFSLDDTELFFTKAETGYLLGVERTIPATELFDLRGSFDFVYITDAKTDSTLPYKSTGNGLQMRADAFYNLSKTSRFGVGYSISAFFNKYSDPLFEARDIHVQTYKAMYLDYNYLF